MTWCEEPENKFRKCKNQCIEKKILKLMEVVCVTVKILNKNNKLITIILIFKRMNDKWS